MLPADLAAACHGAAQLLLPEVAFETAEDLAAREPAAGSEAAVADAAAAFGRC